MCTVQPPKRLAIDQTNRSTTGRFSRRTAMLPPPAWPPRPLSMSLASCPRPPTADNTARHGRIDLTYTLGEDFPAFAPGEEAIGLPGCTIPADGYYLQRWEMYEHTGTHVDAPAHFNPNGRFASELTADELMVPAVVVDIANRSAADPDAVVTVADLRAHERRHGRIEDRAAVLMYSGWGTKVSDPDAYRGTDSNGVLHFPGFSADACDWLIQRRRISALGVDTLSIDPGNSATFDTHTILNGAERYGIENLANLRRIPIRGAQITVGVIPFKLGSGGPAKVLASW